jgi:outer membrane protein OmpA-like peptidoglycan-associated protein
MKKAIISLTVLFLAGLGTIRAQDGQRQAADTSSHISRDTTVLAKDSTAPAKDSTKPTVAVSAPDGVNVVVHMQDSATTPKDSATDAGGKAAASNKDGNPEEKSNSERQLDTRWFISPLLKLQFQDFAMLEKNRKGYLSDANTLPFMQRGNASFAASAYKNLTNRLSFSADIGLSFGHVTNDSINISQTQSKTYNLLNATVYYHLLGPSYRLQPYVSVGINDLISDASYLTAPIGIGAKFNARKIMITGQITYGYAVTKNNANTTMYALGIYIPIRSKKQNFHDDDMSPYNKSSKNDDKKKDTVKTNGPVNVYITINMDSVLKARGLLNPDGSVAGRDGKDGRDGDDGDGDGSGPGGKKRKKRPDLGYEDFSKQDYRFDTVNGQPVVRFVVYFEFNEYGLNTKAFETVDKVIAHVRDKDLSIEIKGYTDDVGAEPYNNFLSRKRAKMVLDYMNSRGVPAELMKAKAYGSDNPVADNNDPNQQWLNRRAEIIVHEK